MSRHVNDTGWKVVFIYEEFSTNVFFQIFGGHSSLVKNTQGNLFKTIMSFSFTNLWKLYFHILGMVKALFVQPA